MKDLRLKLHTAKTTSSAVQLDIHHHHHTGAKLIISFVCQVENSNATTKSHWSIE